MDKGEVEGGGEVMDGVWWGGVDSQGLNDGLDVGSVF